MIELEDFSIHRYGLQTLSVLRLGEGEVDKLELEKGEKLRCALTTSRKAIHVMRAFLR
jgi:hypothetical protein